MTLTAWLAIAVCAVLAALAVLFLAIRRLLLRPAARVARPVSAITMAEVWQAWHQGGLAPAAALAGEAPAGRLDADALAAVRDDLINTETRLLATDDPLTALRREIMDGVDRQMINETVLGLPAAARLELRDQFDLSGSDRQADRYLEANALRTRLLRYYGAAKFADRADNDWYDLYVRAARLKQRSLTALINRRLSSDGASGDRYHAAAKVGEELKRRLLAVPPGTSFPGKAHATAAAASDLSTERNR